MLPPKNSTDSDGLSYNIVKNGGCILSILLTQLFSLSVEVGHLPLSWKSALVTPIHKKGPKSMINNYRPVSVTSCCCRILERIVNNKLLTYTSQYGLLNDSQHGFRRRRSTDSILITFFEYVTDKVDNSFIVDSIYFDFSKAFDTVPHSLLLNKLYSFGIRHHALKWIHNFLSDRFQKVRIEEIISDSLPVTSGVIQGSVLGPTLFNIFINDIDETLNHCQILKYADDIRIFLSASKSDLALQDLQNKVQSDINSMVEWVTHSGMSFNTEKCFIATFGHSQHHRSYKILDTLLVRQDQFKDLGVTVNTSLNFKYHVDSVTSKAFSKLGLINKVFKNKSESSTLTLYKSFVRPQLEYSSVVWCPYTQGSTDKIERVQRRMCRMLRELKGSSYQNQLKKLNILSLQARRLRNQLITIYKMRRGLINLNFRDFFHVHENRTTRGHNCHITPKFAKNNYRLYYFTVSSASLWNKFSQEDIDSPSVETFKSKITRLFGKLKIM
jgi:hypothetical protein